MKKSIVAGVGVCAVALAFAAKDPVIMTVKDTDVPRSEFEYLYNKNSKQQLKPQPLDEYVEMFKLYKMKVVEAKEAGLDTVSAFRKEAEQYRHDLAAPYLADSVYLNSLVAEAYERSKEEVEAKHIMLFKSRNAAENPAIRLRADSIYKALAAGADFEDLAMQLSQDRGSNQNGGNMGYIVAGSFPYDFEMAVYNTPEGAISQIVESPQGYHILKGGKHRPARGKVQVAHILLFTQGKDEAAQVEVKNRIDSIYNVLQANPENFKSLATQYSEDRGSARQGGMLPLFGAREMVEEFDSVAFALKNGEISKPFRTAYGWHIIKKYLSRPIPTLGEMKPQTLSRITNPNDPRSKMVRNHQNATLAKKHKVSLNNKAVTALRGEVSKNGIDSTLNVKFAAPGYASLILATVDGKKYPVAEFVNNISVLNIPASLEADEALNENLDAFYNTILVNAEEDWLLNNKPEYSNLLKEYVDGSLLYEISVREVWDKAAKDTEGLKKFFDANRDNYKWTDPHAKGILVQATNDSVAALIKEYASTLPEDSIVDSVRKKFAKNVGIDRVLVTQGTNAMVDNLVFGGPAVTPANSRMQVYFILNPRVINEPEDVSDVRGLVTGDYQNLIQKQWEDSLRAKYPVTVYEKVLRTVKPLTE